jgi:hypothetical protein
MTPQIPDPFDAASKRQGLQGCVVFWAASHALQTKAESAQEPLSIVLALDEESRVVSCRLITSTNKRAVVFEVIEVTIEPPVQVVVREATWELLQSVEDCVPSGDRLDAECEEDISLRRKVDIERRS